MAVDQTGDRLQKTTLFVCPCIHNDVLLMQATAGYGLQHYLNDVIVYRNFVSELLVHVLDDIWHIVPLTFGLLIPPGLRS